MGLLLSLQAPIVSVCWLTLGFSACLFACDVVGIRANDRPHGRHFFRVGPPFIAFASPSMVRVRVLDGTRQPCAMAFRIKTMSLRERSSVHTQNAPYPVGFPGMSMPFQIRAL